MLNELTLTNESQISAYLHRVRQDILIHLRGEAKTVTQVARLLGVHPANIARHVRLLAETGLINLVETRASGRNAEKFYQAAALRFTVAASQSALREPHALALRYLESDIANACARLDESNRDSVHALIISSRIAPDRLADFHARLDALASEFEASSETSGMPLTLSLALYPSAPVMEHERILITKGDDR
jgi:predicted transcriptional regulator